MVVSSRYKSFQITSLYPTSSLTGTRRTDLDPPLFSVLYRNKCRNPGIKGNARSGSAGRDAVVETFPISTAGHNVNSRANCRIRDDAATRRRRRLNFDRKSRFCSTGDATQFRRRRPTTTTTTSGGVGRCLLASMRVASQLDNGTAVERTAYHQPVSLLSIISLR